MLAESFCDCGYFLCPPNSGATSPAAVVGMTELMMYLIFRFQSESTSYKRNKVTQNRRKKDSEGAAKRQLNQFIWNFNHNGDYRCNFAPTGFNFSVQVPEVIAEGTTFTRIMLGGNFVVLFLFAQRNFSRCGRCGNFDACALDCQYLQHNFVRF